MRHAAGYILFQGTGPGRRFLLLRNARHGTWSFPKGHLEPGEDARSGALRELREETGIECIRELPGFEARLEYEVPARWRRDPLGDGRKILRLFLAEAEDPAFVRSQEHDAGEWLGAGEVLKRLQYEDLKKAFRQALDRLGGSRPKDDDPPPR